MKQIQGILYKNILSETLGKITKKYSLRNKKNYIFVGEKLTSGKNGYAATISNSTKLEGTNKIVGGIQDLSQFQEGDVVLISPIGLISFLYEIDVRSNTIFTTQCCNHRCIMCPQPPIIQEYDRTPLNLRLISLMDKNTKNVNITGGEPTLIGDKLFDIIHQIQKYTPKAAITILSNGVKFSDRNYAEKLALCCHRDLQIDIPIFSDIASEHNRIVGAKTFYKTVQGLYNLALFHLQVGLRIVIHKQTYERLPQLALFIYRNFPFVTQVAFMQMETIGIKEEDIQDLWIDPYDYNEELQKAIFILQERGITPLIYNAQLCVLPPVLRPFAVKSISEWKDAFLPECQGCALYEQCGGFFSTNKEHISCHIHKQFGTINASL